MFDFIPVTSYTAFYYNTMLVLSLMILLQAYMFDIRNQSSILFFNILGYVFAVVLILYMGFRPISYIFADMEAYAEAFRRITIGEKLIINNDYLFNYFLLFCARFMTAPYFFLIVDILYIIPCFLFAKKYFGKYWFFGFFMFVSSFSFWSYGTNGIRNGLGTALFLLGLCFYKRKMTMYVFFVFAFFMHASLIIAITAYALAAQYKNPKVYLWIWFIAIPLSLFGGNYWNTLFSALGFEDRTSGYLTGGEEFKDQFSQTGFRWDFIVYSATAVYAGWYYIFKKGITDKFYIHLFGIFTIANAFWILVIRANFSNRFAYLSWFLMAAVIGYPMFRYKLWNDQYKMFGIILFAYYMFTYLMFLRNGF